MEKVTGKEGKGVQGSGFTGATGSNEVGSLPRSSNANLGIDASVAAGSSDAATTPDSKGKNQGRDTSSTGTDNMSNEKFGIGADISTGTVRGGKRGVNDKQEAGLFGVSALSGGAKMLDPDSVYGSGARKSGTAAVFGEPGRGGSMAMAVRGLSGNSAGPAASGASQPAKGAQKDLKAAEKGVAGTGGSQ